MEDDSPTDDTDDHVITLDSGPVTLTCVLLNRSLLIEDDRWFRLLQDPGEAMTSAEEAIYSCAASGAGKQRKKTRKITHGLYFFGDLYSLAAELYEMMDKNREEIFPHLPKTSSKTGAIIEVD